MQLWRYSTQNSKRLQHIKLRGIYIKNSNLNYIFAGVNTIPAFFMNRIKTITIGVALLFATLSNVSYSQEVKSIKWNYIIIDSLWDAKTTNLESTKIIAKYKPKVDELMATIGTSKKELDKYAPESPLSNLSTDIIYKFGNNYMQQNGIDGGVDMAMLNFGGIRASLPGGPISAYDILSIFPFDNRVVILNIQGKYLKGLFENFAKRERIEAVSGAEIVIDKGVLKKANIGGAPIDDNKFYNVATIDFLMNGGDNVYGLKNHKSVIETNTLMMDVVIDYIKAETAAGRAIDGEKDKRVILIKSSK